MLAWVSRITAVAVACGTHGLAVLSYINKESARSKWASFSGSGVGFGSIVNMAKDGNGGKSPITAAKNQREPIKVTARRLR